VLVIDGAYGEGGGQIVRTSLALSALTGRSVRIENIRAGRQVPGLRPQHLTAARAAASVCVGQLEGDALGSEALTFIPGGSARAGDYALDVVEVSPGGSAGAIGLVLQTVLLPLMLAQGESRVTLRGGTHVPWAPSVSYLQHVFLPMLTRMGFQGKLDLIKWGFYPAGGGEARMRIQGQHQPLSPLLLVERGKLRRIWGIAAVTNLPAHIPQRMVNRARTVLSEADLPAELEPRRLRGVAPGAGLFLCAEYGQALAGFTAYGRKGLPAERVAEAACEELLTYHCSGAPVDKHLADQLVLPMATADGESRLVVAHVSQHLRTSLWLVRQFLDLEASIEEAPGVPAVLVVKGEGL
jgi:RNA 3'-terminal phosphate cyclase (ATP)